MSKSSRIFVSHVLSTRIGIRRYKMLQLVKERLAGLENRPLRNCIYALKDFLRAQPRPILVYQMAKVGSTSVCRSLEAAGFAPLHVHLITREMSRAARERYDGAPPPIEYFTGRLLRPYLRLTSHRLKVITLVRDPIARRISGLYQQPDLNDEVLDDVEETKRAIVESLSRPGALSYTWNWFDREIGRTLNVDVMDGSFDRERGYGVYHGPRADVLVLKLERLSDLLTTAVSRFVDAPLEEVRANVGGKKARGEEYVHVKNTLTLPPRVCDRIYSHEWVRHFYLEEEIAAFKDRWT